LNEAAKNRMSGRITNLYLKPGHGQPLIAVNEATADSGQGLIGDISYGRRKRQVLIIEKETLEHFDLIPGQVKENVTVSGIKLTGLPTGTRLQAGDVLLEVTGDCQPCQQIEDIRPGLRQAMTGKRGTLFRVIDGGSLNINDEVKLI
jgi:hypothetical protein